MKWVEISCLFENISIFSVCIYVYHGTIQWFVLQSNILVVNFTNPDIHQYSVLSMNLNSNSQSVMLTKETLELHQLQQLSQPQNTTRLYTSQFNQRNDSNSQSHIHAVVKQYRPKRSRNGMSPDSPSLPIEKQISKDDTSESQDQSETDHRIDPVLQLTSRVIRQTTARKRTRFDKAPLVDERVKGELSATLVPPPPLHTVLKRTVDLNLQSIHVKNSVENTLKKLYQIKMNEIDVEAKLLQQGSFPNSY